MHLVASITAVIEDGSGSLTERKVALALLAVAEGEGRLPAYGGRPAILAFRRRFGLPSNSMISGTPSRAVFDGFADRFLLEGAESTVETRRGAFFRSARSNSASSGTPPPAPS